MESSTICNQCLSRDQLPACLHQSWLHDRFECNQFLWKRLYHDLLHRHHWNPAREAIPRRATPSSEMVFGKIWGLHQRHLGLVSDAIMVLLFLATWNTSHTCNHELVVHDIRRRTDSCNGLFCLQSQTQIHWSCGASEERVTKHPERSVKRYSPLKLYIACADAEKVMNSYDLRPAHAQLDLSVLPILNRARCDLCYYRACLMQYRRSCILAEETTSAHYHMFHHEECRGWSIYGMFHCVTTWA